VHPAAAVLTFLCPGLRFFHDGQLDGRMKKLSVHLARRPDEVPNEDLREFYSLLLKCIHLPIAQNGDWRLLDCSPAWEGNWTSDCFIGFAWQADGRGPLLVAVNYSGNQSQGYLQVPFGEIRGHAVRLQDLMSDAAYDRDGDDLLSRGLYLDMAPWGYHVFELSLQKGTQPSS
jgi:hypothetical protein